MTHRFPAAVGLVALLFAAARAENYTWNAPAGGNWNEGAKWTASGGGTGVVPAAADNVLIDTAGIYTVALTDARSIAAVAVNRSTATLNHTGGVFTVGTAFDLTAGTYTLNNGTLTLNGTMTTAAGSTLNFTAGTWNGTGSAAVNGAFNWSGGTIGGSNTVTATGPITLAGTGTKFLTGTKTLVLDADATWSAGSIFIDGGTTFRVAPGRVIDNTGNTAFWFNSTTGGTFDIQGTFRKSVGTGTTEFRNGPVYNLASSGTLDIQSGTLDVAGNATYAGTITLGTGTTFRLSNGTQTFAAGATLNLTAGTVAVATGTHTAAANFSPGTLFVSGGTFTLNGAASAPGTLTVSAGTLNGSGATTAGTAFTWTGGTIGGSNTLTAAGPVTLAGAVKVLTGTKTLALDADATWSAGDVWINNGTTVRLAPGRVLENTANTIFWFQNTAGGTFDIQGTFRKTGGAVATEFRAGPVYNLASTGTLDIQAGRVDVSGDAIYAGTIILGAGRTLRLATSTQTFTAGATLNLSAGIVEVTGGTVTAEANLSPGTLTISSGTLTLNGAANAPGTLTMTGGTLNGSGAISAGTAFTWTGGTISGSNTLTASGPVTLSGTGTRLLAGTKTLALDADATWSAGSIFIDGGTTFRVAPGRVMDNMANTTFWFQNTAGGTFDIQGTFRKTAGTGVTEFRSGPVYDVTGTVDVRSGTLQVAAAANLVGYTANTLGRGTWRTQNATLDFPGRTVQTIGPAATVEFDGATSTFAALDALTTNNGTLRVLGGKTFTPTAASVNNAGTLEVGAGSTFGRPVVVQPTGRLEGAGTVTGAVSVNGTVAPGSAAAPVGTLTTGGQTWAGGGVYEVSYDQIFGPYTAGTDHDLLSSTGGLSVTATPASPFTIRMHYTGTGEFADPPPDATIRIASFAGGVPATLDLTAFQLVGDTYHGGGTFALTTQGNDVFLTFTPVPEPATVLALAAVGLLGARAVRRRRAAATPRVAALVDHPGNWLRQVQGGVCSAGRPGPRGRPSVGRPVRSIRSFLRTRRSITAPVRR